MWYLICLGIGLLIGLGFLIWALHERSVRQKAETAAVEAQHQLETANKIAKNNATMADDLQKEVIRGNERLAVLRKTLVETQKRLLSCNDPQTVKEWLDAELKGETI